MALETTPEELYDFILENAEELDGQLVCRASIIAELKKRGDPTPGATRTALVKELQSRGLVTRLNVRGRWLVIDDDHPDYRAKTEPKP